MTEPGDNGATGPGGTLGGTLDGALAQTALAGTASNVATAPPRGEPLDSVFAAACGAEAASELAAFLVEEDPRQALAIWLQLTRCDAPPSRAATVVGLLQRDVAALDRRLGDQLDRIMHTRAFQRLEASWRGLLMLVECAERVREMDAPPIKIRVLNLRWTDLTKDLSRAMEFDHSQLFRKIYEEEFGAPGGEPYGVLLGDFEVRHRPGPGHPTNDVDALRSMSQIAAASFAPFVVGADPVLLGVDEFSELEIAQELPRTFEQVEYVPWNSLRGSEDARFLGVVLPRVLMREPYDGLHTGNARFPYRENVGGTDRSRYLWGSAVYAFGSVLIRAFADCGWLADIRGAPSDGWSGGLVDALPVHSFGTDAPGVAPKYTTDVLITDDREKELADLGLIGLCHLRGTRLAAFFSNQSLQRPKKYDTPAATTNAQLSSMLQYLFCVARFSHYLKVMARDQIGKLTTAAECERRLQNWVLQYCTAATDLGLETRSRYPLSEASVAIKEHPGKPGRYLCVMHLKPHFQLDQIISAVRLVTELAPIQV